MSKQQRLKYENILYMKLYEAVKQAIEVNGTDIVKDIRMVNMLSDLHAYDDIPSAKFVLRTVITEGYGERLLNIGEWNEKCGVLIQRFVSETGVQKAVAELVCKSLAYGIGWIKDESEMVPSSSSSSSSPSPQPSPTPAQPPKPSLDPSDLTLTPTQVMKEGECHGQGEVRRPYCNGKGICMRCHGGGYIKCTSCDASGWADGISGSGRCSKCGGRGIIECPTCHGTGVCPMCG